MIEVAGLILDSYCMEIEDANTSDLVKPNRPIPTYITELTTIANDDVSMALSFPEVADKFIRFISEQADNKGNVEQIILVGQYAKGFDIPFLVHQLNVHGMSGRLFEDKRIRYGIDTLQLARKGIKECFSPTGRSQRQKTGLLCSPIDVNTPIRAWRQVFTHALLEKIVRYTNEYGQLHAKRWKDIEKKDLEAFFSVLFISGIQKRKDKPSNWFSDNRLLESTVIKKVMSGRKFSDLLRYLHCCPVQNQDHNAENYDPIYKVAEVRDYLEVRFSKLLHPKLSNRCNMEMPGSAE